MSAVLLASSTIGAGGHTAYADDSHHQQYSVLYGGNYSPADAHRFSYRLYHYGGAGSWAGKTQTSYNAPETDVAHWDITNGYPGVDPWQGANQRDLMYLSTHGWPGQMRFYSPRWVGSTPEDADWRRRIDQNRKNDNIGPRKDDLCGSDNYGWERNLWEIGTTYKSGTVTRTNSRWNDDIEWVFLAACHQLSSSGGSPGSRALYARTLLGDPRRAHSIMGYHSTAPGDATDTSIVDSFFNLLERGNSIRFSWLQANSLYSGSARNAAVLLHEKHTYEGLPPVSGRQTDSPTGGPVDIRYWYLNALGNQVGGTQLSSADSLWTRGIAAARRLFAIPQAMAGSQPRVIQGRDSTFRVAIELPDAPDEVGPLILKSERRSPSEVARGVLGKRARAGSVDPVTGMTRFEEGDRELIVFGGDGFLLQDGDEYGIEVADFGVDDAVSAAEAYAAMHGGLPTDAVLNDVTGVMAASLDPMTGEMSSEATHAYIVEYRHEFDGVPIAGNEGDTISVVVAADKRVCQLRNTWREVSHRGQPTRLISSSDALETLVREGERTVGLPVVVDITGVRLVYYSNKSSSRQTVMWPAWEFSLVGEGDENDAIPAIVYVDARSGGVVTD